MNGTKVIIISRDNAAGVIDEPATLDRTYSPARTVLHIRLASGACVLNYPEDVLVQPDVTVAQHVRALAWRWRSADMRARTARSPYAAQAADRTAARIAGELEALGAVRTARGWQAPA
jgi:hypothetical protein